MAAWAPDAGPRAPTLLDETDTFPGCGLRRLLSGVIPAKAGTQYSAAFPLGFDSATGVIRLQPRSLCLLDPRFRGDDGSGRGNCADATLFPGATRAKQSTCGMAFVAGLLCSGFAVPRKDESDRRRAWRLSRPCSAPARIPASRSAYPSGVDRWPAPPAVPAASAKNDARWLGRLP
jgi:hypothetical protein